MEGIDVLFTFVEGIDLGGLIEWIDVL